VEVRQINRDPMAEAERGTLKYAASTSLMTVGVSVTLSRSEAVALYNSLQHKYPSPRGGVVCELIDGLFNCVVAAEGEDS